ncbi:MAG: UTP--glucose-1-phosphate uridylyltransferase GalU [Peptococcaceae bacterium]|nr:UTP--glucose-1-phosphate uridylyltransferase GalU [Peptococcaceae bacterium]MDH7524522.1 UTP--glucose-1-phosphate uridylyltransferase GalU [Peptococcaceae bacterium]
MRIRKAVIPAAGLGTRFLPATKAQPKEMLPIVDKPTIQYIVEEAIQSGIEDIIIVTGRGKTAIEDHFDRSYELEAALNAKGKRELLNQVEYISNMASVYYVRQKEAKGLGHAVWSARKFIGDEPFAVLLGDDVVISEKPCLKQMMEVFEEYRTPVIGIREVDRFDVSKYGVIKSSGQIKKGLHSIVNMVEKPYPEAAPSNLAIMGRYILTPEIIPILDTLPPGSGGEIQLTDAIRELNKTQKVLGYEFEGIRYDVGDKVGLIKATVEFALRRDDLKKEVEKYLVDLVYSQLGFRSPGTVVLHKVI